MTGLAVLAGVALAYALVSQRLDLSAISAPMVFVVAGIVAGPDVLGLAELKATEGTAVHVAEITLALLLFADAARIDLRSLRGDADLPWRLLAIGMPLTILLGMATGAVLLTGLGFWEAAIVAAVLAPTDAALGQVVVTSRAVPARIRQALIVESGLNDGLSVPFLALFVAIAVDQAVPAASDWVVFAAEQIGLGGLIGVAVGGAGAWLLERSAERGLTTPPFEQFGVLSLAVLAFVLADAAGGNGFIAAFAGGLAAGRVGSASGELTLRFTEEEGQLLGLAVFFVFGTAAIGFLDSAGAGIVVYGLLSLTLVRMVPVAVAVRGMGFRPSTVAFLGWFGPRGLASIILALFVAEEEPELPALGVILSAMTVTVLASVLLHGVTALPGVRAYARATRGDP
jgi:sodium/hydrogen antiporter